MISLQNHVFLIILSLTRSFLSKSTAHPLSSRLIPKIIVLCIFIGFSVRLLVCISLDQDGNSDRSSWKVSELWENIFILTLVIHCNLSICIHTASGLGEASCRLFGYMGLDSSADPRTDSFKLSFEEQTDRTVRHCQSPAIKEERVCQVYERTWLLCVPRDLEMGSYVYSTWITTRFV